MLLLLCDVIFAQGMRPLIPPDPAIETQFNAVLSDPRVQKGLQLVQQREPLTVEEQLEITEIPAPPFMEQRRAEDFLQRVRALGLSCLLYTSPSPRD